MRFPFIGPTYSSMSYSADCQQTVNLYPEVVESGVGINNIVLYGTPGLLPFATCGAGPIRALWPGENRLFAISADQLYEIYQDSTVAAYSGSVGNDGKPAQILSNGNQLLVISAGGVYIYNGTAMVPVTYPALSGYVDTAGFTASIIQLSGAVNTTVLGEVDFVSGQNFRAGAAMIGQTIDIGGTNYTIAASPVPTSTVLYVVEPIGVLTGALYDCTIGDLFDPSHMAGLTVTINSTPYTVASPAGTPYALHVTSALGSHATVAWSATPVVTASTGTYLDGYFIISEPSSKTFRISALLDGSTWDPLDFATKEAYPDNIARVMADHEQLWIFGTEASTEIWVDTGAANFPLQRSPGALIHYACFSAISPVQLDNGVAWIGGDEIRGGPIAWCAQGFQPIRVSNSAIENVWRQMTRYDDAVSYSYIENGHHFWVINFPTAAQTWCYDATTKMWHQRAWWNGTANTRQRQAFHAYVALAPYGIAPFIGPAHYVGDWQSGGIYIQHLGAYTDQSTVGTAAIHRVRISPHIQKENQRFFYSKFELLMDLSGGTVVPVLDYSVDRGTVYVNPRARSSAAAGLTDPLLMRLLWWRNGTSRDRIWRVTITDAVAIAIIDGYFDAEQCTS